MGLLSGLSKLGLGSYESAELLEKNKPSTGQGSANNKPATPIKTPEEIEREAIFDKHFQCPVCDLQSHAKIIRSGKTKLVGKDTDLRPIYDAFDPLKYDVMVCDKCGYAALTRYFGRLSTRQIKDLHDEVAVRFNGIDLPRDIYSYDDAIMRYKLALVCAIAKKAKNSERAYIMMKLAWVIRGKRQSIDERSDEAKALYKDEMECIENAYEGFVQAMASETPPIAGMDENTLMYLLAEFARRMKKYEEAARLVGSLIVRKNINPRLKDQALELKEMIKADFKNAE